jgi:NTE family protein
MATKGSRPRVGLALGGGAARGLAHLGVLRAFECAGIPIHVLTGTSMGAVLGAAWIAEGDAARVETRLRDLLASDGFRRLRMDFLRETRRQKGGLLYSMGSLLRQGIVFGVSSLRRSFLSAEEFAANIHTLVPDVQIETLRYPFAATALDLISGEEIVQRSGSLREAVAASSAIPALLPPVRRGARLLADGGWVDKVPVLPAFALGAEVVVAVDITAELEEMDEHWRGIDVMARANEFKDQALVGFSRRMADVLIEPPVKQVHWADFQAADAIVQAGEEAGRAAIPEILGLLRRERWLCRLRRPRGLRAARAFLEACPPFRME